MLYVVYLVAGNYVLRSGLLAEWLQQRPLRNQVMWQSASTWWPGQLHVEGLRFRHASPRMTWQISADEASVRFGLLGFFWKRVRIKHLDGHGYTVLMRRADVNKVVGPLQPAVPPLYGPADQEVQPRTGQRKGPAPWRIEVLGLRLHEPKEIWLGPYHLRGEVEVDGGFDAVPRGEVEVQPSRLVLRDAELTAGDRQLASSLDLTLDIAFAPFVPRENKGRNVLSFASGRLEIEGRFAGLGLLSEYLKPYPWLRVESSGGPVQGELVFAAGHVTEGSRLTMGTLPLTVAFHGGQAVGKAMIVADVQSVQETLLYRLAFMVDDAQGGALDDEALVATVPRLEIEATDDAFHLVHGFSDPALRVEVPEATFPDLGFLSEHLPPSAGLHIRRGQGQMALRVEATPNWLDGHLQVNGNALDMVYRDQSFVADATFDAAITGGDLQEGVFDLRDATFEVESATSWQSKGQPSKSGGGDPTEPWTGLLQLEDGSLRVTDPWHLKGELELELTDTAPLFALYLQERRFLKHFQRALTVRDVDGTAVLHLGRRLLTLRHVDLTGERLELLGQLDLTDAPPNGLLWARFHGLSAAVELDSGKKDLRVIKPRRWYDEKLPRWLESEE